MKVLLLAGGSSNEREVSLRSGNYMETALKSAGYEVRQADPTEAGFDLEELAKTTDVVFLALHGAGGEDGTLQAKLEALNIPFVGCNSVTSALCFDKWRYKQLLKDNNLPTPESTLVTKNDLSHPLFKQPFVLKPIKGGSTIDVVIARAITQPVMDECAGLLQKYDQMLLEKLVEGPGRLSRRAWALALLLFFHQLHGLLSFRIFLGFRQLKATVTAKTTTTHAFLS